MDSSLRKYFRHGMFPQLLAFEACVRRGSVTRAAEELSLAQPTVSCLVKKLSGALGGPLMRVRDRRIEATPLGNEVVVLCRELLDAFGGFEARSAAGPRYDRCAATSEPPPWVSPSPQESSSPSKPHASRLPPAKRRPAGTTGGS